MKKNFTVSVFLIFTLSAMSQPKAQYSVKYTADHTYQIYFKFLTDITGMVSGPTDGTANFRIQKSLYATDPTSITTATADGYIFSSMKKQTPIGSDNNYWLMAIAYSGATGNYGTDNNNTGTFSAGTEYLIATIKFGAAIPINAIDVADYPNNQIGGAGVKAYGFYMAVDGTVVDNDAAIFYGNPTTNAPANGGGINSLSTLSFNSTILPISLTSFNATNTTGKVSLTWTTATELNNANFVVERSSNAISFSSIATVAAVGIGANSYATIDANPLSGVSFYRLKSVDKDGAITYSSILKVNFDASNSISVFPTPAASILNLNVASASLIGTSASLVDIGGRIVKTFIINSASEHLDVSNLVSSVYFIRLIDGTCVKIVKQ